MSFDLVRLHADVVVWRIYVHPETIIWRINVHPKDVFGILHFHRNHTRAIPGGHERSTATNHGCNMLDEDDFFYLSLPYITVVLSEVILKTFES